MQAVRRWLFVALMGGLLALLFTAAGCKPGSG